MRRILVLALILITSGSLLAQGVVRSLGSFKGVRASQGIDVYLKKGDKETARVEASGVDASEVVTEISGTNLKIHMLHGNYSEKRVVKVYVTYLTVDKISASSGANVFSEGPINSTSMDLSAYSGASVEVTLESESVKVETSSAGDVVLEGKTTSLSAETSSGGVIDAYKLSAENVTASASSGGDAKISVAKALTANANSGGSIRYRGNPSKTMTNASSGGSVKKSN